MNNLKKTIDAINKANKEGLITETAYKGMNEVVSLLNEGNINEAKNLSKELHESEFSLISVKLGDRVKKGNVSTRLVSRLAMNIIAFA